MAASAKKPARSRMTAAERREQLIEIARTVFSERGFNGASVEEIAARAEVSKPVVDEHFGGDEGQGRALRRPGAEARRQGRDCVGGRVA